MNQNLDMNAPISLSALYQTQDPNQEKKSLLYNEIVLQTVKSRNPIDKSSKLNLQTNPSQNFTSK